MAESGKKIVFEGQASGLVKAADDSKKSLVSLHDSNIKGLKDTNSLLKEQNTLLEKQKQLITSIASEGLSKPQQQAVGQLTQRLFASSDRVNPEHLKSYSKILESQMHIGDSKTLSEKLIQKIQELIDTQKLQHRETFAHHQKDDELKGVSRGAKGLLHHEINKGALSFLGKEVEKSRSLEKIEKLNAKSLEKFNGDEVKSERSDKIISILEHVMHGNVSEAAKETAEGGLGKNLPWIAAAIAAAGYGYHKLKEIQSAEAGAQTGEQLAHEYIEMNPLNLELTKNLPGQRRHRSELSKFQQSLFSSAATTGIGGGFMSDSMDEQFANLGMSSAEAESIRSGSSRSRGKRASDEAIYGSAFANKVLGIDQGNISALENQSRYGGSDNVKNIVEKVITNLGGQTKANENLQMLVSIGQQQLHTLGKIDQAGNIALIKAFQSTGGALMQNSETLSPIIGNFNQALSNPKGDFQRAERFATLSKLNPGKSFPQLMREMQKGKDSPGVIKETLARISKRGGGIDGMVMELVSSGLASNYEEAFELAEGYMKNDAIFDNLSGAGINGKETKGQIGNIVDRFDKGSSARISSAFAKSVSGGMKTSTNEAALFEAESHSKPVEEVIKKSVTELFSATDNMADGMRKAAIETKLATSDIKDFGKATKESTKAFKDLLNEINKNGIRNQ